MSVEIYFENKKIITLEQSNPTLLECSSLKQLVSNITNVPECDLFATQNGRPLSAPLQGCSVRFSCRLVGGKGGFGSMLRAIGAQIEKTTNREACRDLSGRRLRDIREEQRLREWAASRPQRNEEAKRRKEQRLKRLCAIPSHEFQDPAYEEARKNLEEVGGEAVDVGIKAAPAPLHNKPKRKKTAKLWIDEDLSDVSSNESGCEEDNEAAAKLEALPVTGKGKGVGKRTHAVSADSGQPAAKRQAPSPSDSPHYTTDDGIEDVDSNHDSSNDSNPQSDKKNSKE